MVVRAGNDGVEEVVTVPGNVVVGPELQVRVVNPVATGRLNLESASGGNTLDLAAFRVLLKLSSGTVHRVD